MDTEILGRIDGGGLVHRIPGFAGCFAKAEDLLFGVIQDHIVRLKLGFEAGKGFLEFGDGVFRGGPGHIKYHVINIIPESSRKVEGGSNVQEGLENVFGKAATGNKAMVALSGVADRAMGA